VEAESVKRDQFFALGVAVGTALGLVVGSAIAIRIGSEGVDTVRRLLTQLIGHEDEPNFEYLLQ
jgi:hypothetical protein